MIELVMLVMLSATGIDNFECDFNTPIEVGFPILFDCDVESNLVNNFYVEVINNDNVVWYSRVNDISDYRIFTYDTTENRKGFPVGETIIRITGVSNDNFEPIIKSYVIELVPEGTLDMKDNFWYAGQGSVKIIEKSSDDYLNYFLFVLLIAIGLSGYIGYRYYQSQQKTKSVGQENKD